MAAGGVERVPLRKGRARSAYHTARQARRASPFTPATRRESMAESDRLAFFSNMCKVHTSIDSRKRFGTTVTEHQRTDFLSASIAASLAVIGFGPTPT